MIEVWELLTITLLNGSQMAIAPRYIVSVIEARQADDPGKHYTEKVRCIVTLIDNKTITTEEECDSIEARLKEMAERRIKELRK
jgi:hypothetical protein